MRAQPSPSGLAMSAREFVATVDAFDVAQRRDLTDALLRLLVVDGEPDLDEGQWEALHTVLIALHGIAVFDEVFLEDDLTAEHERKLFAMRQWQAEKRDNAAKAITAETMRRLMLAIGNAALAAHRQARAQAPTVH